MTFLNNHKLSSKFIIKYLKLFNSFILSFIKFEFINKNSELLS